MNETHSHAESGYKSYWIVWGILLAFTAFMLIAEYLPFSKTLVVAMLLVAMIFKASLIGGKFMHLSTEQPGLVWAVAGSVIFLSVYMFILISVDGMRIFHMVRP